MKTYLDCIPCFFRQALAAARLSTDDETIHRRVLNSVSTMIPDLALDVTPPEIAQQVYRMVYEITGNNDPYLEVKKCANTSAMTFYPHMKLHCKSFFFDQTGRFFGQRPRSYERHC